MQKDVTERVQSKEETEKDSNDETMRGNGIEEDKLKGRMEVGLHSVLQASVLPAGYLLLNYSQYSD